jgi:hypothetical protein
VTVLVRYPQALSVAVLLGFAAWLAIVRRRARDLVALAAGVGPVRGAHAGGQLAALRQPPRHRLSPGPDWWSMPWQWGIPLVLLSPCRGYSSSRRRSGRRACSVCRDRAALVIALLLAALVPVLLIARTQGWSGSQCWGIRYVTPSVVIVLVTLLALGRPWTHSPRLFWACALLGAAFQLGGVLAPYRGHQLLADRAAASSGRRRSPRARRASRRCRTST